MSALTTDLRNKLERVIVEARDVAEGGAKAALEALAVHHHEPYGHMTPQQRKLRNHLRAHARQLGDRQDRQGRLDINRIIHECAFEHWHRMLFARFLAENHLLIEPQENIAISLEEAEELAKETGEDVWTFASRCAQRMLPQIFRPDDPLLAVSFATEHMLKPERLLDSLQSAVFSASDALGWVYQFWQSKKKDEVNRSEVKIGADELPAVTQLFTEPYMVSFLIHNTLGAWWAGKRFAENPKIAEEAKSEDELRAAVSLPGMDWEYLRFVQGEDGDKGPWRPASGTFDGWPQTAAELKVLDPCCGSGHFLVAALSHLVPIRMAEEGLTVAEAVDAVLRDNLHGLEIDERCCQIAAFALALAAWTYPDAGGYRPLPDLHIACTGIGPNATEEQWLKLTEQSGVPMPTLGREPIKNGLLNLHELFSKAPTLGSLIDPNQLPADLIAADYETLQPYLAAALTAEHADDETHERAVAAAGMVKAAELLAGEYSLVITNVPYLGRGKQDDVLKEHLEKHYKDGKADLATAFVLRCLEFCAADGSTALVTPQNWLFLTTYKKLRAALLKQRTWKMVARLGPGAFETIGGHVVNVALIAVSATPPAPNALMAGIDVSSARQPDEKAALLRGLPVDPPGLPPTAGEVRPTEGLVPAKERMAPATVRTVPAEEWMIPAKERTVPAEEWMIPAKEWTAPAEERTVPAKERTTRSKERMIRSPAAEDSQRAQKAPARPGNDVSSPQDGPDDPGEAPSPPTAPSPKGRLTSVPQAEQLKNPDAVVLTSRHQTGALLEEVAPGLQGTSSADNARFRQCFWEQAGITEPWAPLQGPVTTTQDFGGCEGILFWGDGEELHAQSPGCAIRGTGAYGLAGVAVSRMGPLPVARYLGGVFEDSVAVIPVARGALAGAVWACCSSATYREQVRRLNQKLSVANATLVKVPFDLAHWQKVAAEEYPDGLPEPESDDPTQWLFHGRPEESTAPLQVAVARLLGYRWPAELDDKMRLSKRARDMVKQCDELLKHADDDGIGCIQSVRGEEAAVDRLMALLSACGITSGKVRELTDGAGLDDWLRNSFFEEHCKLFLNRPFIWHIWDGRKRDGFHALVNYHKLAEGNGKGRKLLESLTYSYLRDWISRQEDGVKRGEGGAEDRLAAALELKKRLEAILAGEPPYDIFVRWKPLHEQPIGWEPDINDGVRLNIRPFLAGDLPNGRKGAGILRCKPNIKWKKDRGKEPKRPKGEYPWFWNWDENSQDFLGNREFDGNRWNDCHYTNKAKQQAREEDL